VTDAHQPLAVIAPPLIRGLLQDKNVITSVIEVTLVGGRRLQRGWLRQSLVQSGFVVVAERSNFSSVQTKLVEKGVPQLVLAKFSRQSDKDFEGLRRLRDAAPDWRIVVLSTELNLADLVSVLRAGADGYLVSEISLEVLSLSLLLVMSGEKVLPGSLADVLASDRCEFRVSTASRDHHHLTERERMILQCLTKGYSNKVIARILNITEGTVKVHLKSLMRKISVVNRTQAALWAGSRGIGDDLDTR
jgi:two-component system nitrate/nitrite response regulator NarL